MKSNTLIISINKLTHLPDQSGDLTSGGGSNVHFLAILQVQFARAVLHQLHGTARELVDAVQRLPVRPADPHADPEDAHVVTGGAGETHAVFHPHDRVADGGNTLCMYKYIH